MNAIANKLSLLSLEEVADIAAPADLVRNEAGQIIGCRALEVND